MGKIFGAFRSEPVKAGAAKGNLQKHCAATEEYAKDQQAKQMEAYGYSYIEPQNVRHNKVLVDCKKSYNEKIKECNQEKFGGRTIRRDGIPMIDTVFYFSPEKTPNLLCYFHRNNTHWKQEHADWWADYQALSDEERHVKRNEEFAWVKSWAEASEKWAEKNLGQVVHCVLHCHEGTPHLDCKTLAIKYKEEQGKWIWAKREILGNPKHLSTMQDKYAEECGEKFGLERGEIHEEGAIREHAKTARHMAQKSKEDLEKQIKSLAADKSALEGHVEALRGYIKRTNKVLMGVMQGDEMDGAELWKNAIRLYAEQHGLKPEALLREVRQAMRTEAHNLVEESQEILER